MPIGIPFLPGRPRNRLNLLQDAMRGVMSPDELPPFGSSFDLRDPALGPQRPSTPALQPPPLDEEQDPELPIIAAPRFNRALTLGEIANAEVVGRERPTFRSRLGSALEGMGRANLLDPESDNPFEAGLTSALSAFAGVRGQQRGEAQDEDELSREIVARTLRERREAEQDTLMQVLRYTQLQHALNAQQPSPAELRAGRAEQRTTERDQAQYEAFARLQGQDPGAFGTYVPGRNYATEERGYSERQRQQGERQRTRLRSLAKDRAAALVGRGIPLAGIIRGLQADPRFAGLEPDELESVAVAAVAKQKKDDTEETNIATLRTQIQADLTAGLDDATIKAKYQGRGATVSRLVDIYLQQLRK